jgi:hypothetical protein
VKRKTPEQATGGHAEVAAGRSSASDARGGYRINPEGSPGRTPLSTRPWLARAERAGSHIGDFCQPIYRRPGELEVLGLAGKNHLRPWGLEMVKRAKNGPLTSRNCQRFGLPFRKDHNAVPGARPQSVDPGEVTQALTLSVGQSSIRMIVQKRFSVRVSRERCLTLKLNALELDSEEGRSRVYRPAGYHTERSLRRNSRCYLAGSNNLSFDGICVSISRTSCWATCTTCCCCCPGSGLKSKPTVPISFPLAS